MMKTLDLLYEGKAKQVFKTDDPDKYIIRYKNTATALNGQRKEEIEGKGRLNCEITGIIYRMLTEKGVKNHFIEQLNETDILVKKVLIVPLEVIVRNVAAGSFSKRYGVAEGTKLLAPVLEFSYKNDELNDPLINDYHIIALGIASRNDLDTITSMAFDINMHLTEFFKAKGIKLIDFKIEIGRSADGELMLADEISPDTCRFWDAGSDEKLDKDRFRRNMGNVIEAYEEIYRRITR